MRTVPALSQRRLDWDLSRANGFRREGKGETRDTTQETWKKALEGPHSTTHTLYLIFSWFVVQWLVHSHRPLFALVVGGSGMLGM